MKYRKTTLTTLFSIIILLSAFGCSGSEGTPTDDREIEIPVPTATLEDTSSHILTTTCEQIPNEAVVKFLYGLEVPFLVAEDKPNGIYCRFESVVVEGQGGDLGRGLAAATIKLWDNIDSCMDAAESAGSAEITPPSPWSYVSILPIPGKPELILSVAAHDGAKCVTVSAPDISSQPLEVWLEFIEAIAGSY